MVPLEMQGDVSKGDRVTVDIKGADGEAEVLAGFLRPLDLALEVLGEV
jgi:hypothetical protein